MDGERRARDGLKTVQAKGLGGLGGASGGSPSRAPGRANGSAWEAVNEGITEISETSAAAQHVMLAVPPQQWLAQSDMPESLAGAKARAKARATSRRTLLD